MVVDTVSIFSKMGLSTPRQKFYVASSERRKRATTVSNLEAVSKDKNHDVERISVTYERCL